MIAHTIRLAATAAAVPLLAALAAGQCPPGSTQQTAVFADTFGPFSGIFDTELVVPQWNPNDYPRNAELAQVEIVVSSALSSAAFISNDGDSSCTGTWSAANDVSFEGIPGMRVPPTEFSVMRSESFNLDPGTQQTFPLETVTDGAPPIVENDAMDRPLWSGSGQVTFPIEGLTATTCDSNCGQVFCDIDLFAQITVTVTYTYCLMPNNPPVCLGGGILNVPCTGDVTPVQLDATASFDPDEDPLTYYWSPQCPNATIDDPTSPTPTLFVMSEGACNADCIVLLRVSDGLDVTSCIARIFVYDAIAPAIDCVPEVEAACGSTDPMDVGMPTVTDACDSTPSLVFDDVVVNTNSCAASRVESVIERTWTATDTCGNTSTCTQRIEVTNLQASLDASPGECPNVLPIVGCQNLVFCPNGGSGVPSSLRLVYTGDSCGSSHHAQSPGNYRCFGDPAGAPSVRILVTDGLAPTATVWHDAIVALGDTYDVDASAGGATALGPVTWIRVFDNAGNLLQQVEFSTACGEPLRLGDQLGASMLAGFDLTDGTTGGAPAGGFGPVVLTIAGSASFDVAAIDTASVQAWRAECNSGGLAPTNFQFVDETRPADDPTTCPDRSPDGLVDLRLEFDRDAFIQSLMLGPVPVGTNVPIRVSGDLLTGCGFVAWDEIVIGSCGG